MSEIDRIYNENRSTKLGVGWLATLQVAAMLRKAGHEVALFDAMLADDLSRFERQLDVLKPQLVLLYEDNYNFLSKMCLGRMRRAACEMLGAARQRRREAFFRSRSCPGATDPRFAGPGGQRRRYPGHSRPRRSAARIAARAA